MFVTNVTYDLFPALQYILRQKDHSIDHCESISPYSEFLGLKVTTGAVEANQPLSNFVSHPLMKHFLLQNPSGFKKLGIYLGTLGMVIDKEGIIATDPTLSNEDSRSELDKNIVIFTVVFKMFTI